MLSHIKGSSCQESWPNILNAVNAGGGILLRRHFSFQLCSDGASYRTASETSLWIISMAV